MDNPNHDPIRPIYPLLEDPEITELMIDGWQRVYVEKRGRLQDVPTPFHNDGEVYDLIHCIIGPMGKVVNESYPYVEARLEDGTRFNAVIPPIALLGPIVTLRKTKGRGELSVEKLIEWNSFSQAMIDFLRACVLSRLNVVVAGGTASGKTTFLQVLSRWIPDEERIIVLQHEDFHMHQKRAINLETRPANIEGRGAVTMRDLVGNAARMRPDRILVSEVNGDEVLDLLTLMNNGYDGTLFSIHANSLRDALSRLEIMAQLGNPGFPLPGLRELIASAVDVILYLERLPDGSRKIIKIAEVTGLEDGLVTTRDLFEFRRTRSGHDRIEGYFSATGAVPQFLQRITEVSGIEIPLTMFTPAEG
jgi:pilus assembly protein CpaF